jgi:peptidoglycan/LPS O-acetylase OafA/YrhL
MHYLDGSQLYTNPERYHTISLDNTLPSTVNIATFFGNLLMMQGLLVGNLGSNTPLWSLSYEWWYYCIFALIAASYTSAARARFLFAIGGILLAIAMPVKLLLWGTIWLLGLVAYRWARSVNWKPHPAMGFLALTSALALSRLSHNTNNINEQESLIVEFGRDLVVALAFTVAIVGASHMSRSVPFARLHHRLADFSYSTYLCHFPFLMLLTAAGFDLMNFRFRVQPDGNGSLYAAAIVLVIYVYSYLFSLVTEQRTWWMRRLLDGRPTTMSPGK